jgi:hypothetical protein
VAVTNYSLQQARAILAATSGAPVGSLGAVTGLYHSHVRVTLRLYTRPVHVQQETKRPFSDTRSRTSLHRGIGSNIDVSCTPVSFRPHWLNTEEVYDIAKLKGSVDWAAMHIFH